MPELDRLVMANTIPLTAEQVASRLTFAQTISMRLYLILDQAISL
jgi:hypothetical protein